MGLAQFIGRRTLQALITLLGATLMFFSAVTIVPGDPVRALFGFQPPPPEIYEAIVAHFRLEEPFVVQYLGFLENLVQGDFGYTYPRDPWGTRRQGPAVSALIAGSLPVTLRIVGAAMVVQVIGLAAGVLTGLRRGSKTSVSVYLAAIAAVSVPALVLAYGLQSYLGLKLGWFPFLGVSEGWTSYVLPVAALSVAATAYVVLMTRSGLNETLRMAFVQQAEARGLPRGRVVGLHALRASMVPVLTFMAANLGQLVAGAMVVEAVFQMPGLGGILFEAIARQDRALIVWVLTLLTVAIIVANALADVLYAIIDPRIRTTS